MAVTVGQVVLAVVAVGLLAILPHKQAVLAVVEYWFCSLTEQPQLF
jgi:hypothetical protein